MGYLDLVGSFVYKDPVFRAKLDALAENDAQLKTDGWAQSTKLLFFQATVPTGWTQDITQNDKALRLVGTTGGGVSGGTVALSSNVALAHTHAGFGASDNGFHTHAYAAHTHEVGPSGDTYSPSGEIMIDNGDGFMSRYATSGGAFSATPFGDFFASPGAIVLGSTGSHDHGAVTGSSLTDFIFSYCDVILGAKDAASGTYVDLTTYWHTGDKIDFDPFTSYAQNDDYNNRALMPSGSIVIWGQASAPTGWTKLATLDDRMLRVVNTLGAGTGGNQPISSGVSLAHSHSLAVQGTHAHTIPNHQHTLRTLANMGSLSAKTNGKITESIAGTRLAGTSTGGGASSQTTYKPQTTNGGSGSTDSKDSHTHTIVAALADFTMAYVDVIQCSKNSSGAPYGYTDYTSEFAWKKLVTYQRLNTLAKNDSYIQYHTTPAASQCFFFMPTPPTGWVKITSQHDKCLRMVSGGTGGIPGGGAQLLSATIALAHTHGITADPDHTHAVTHTHAVDSGSLSVTAQTNNYVQAGRSFLGGSFILAQIDPTNPSLGVAFAMNKTSETANEASAAAGSHAHGGVTDSKLSDIVLAYADVIWCSKS